METVSVIAGTHKTMQHQVFTKLVEQHQGIIFKVTRIYCWHTDDQADLAQEILAQCWRAFPKYDEQRKFSTWMYRIALNVAISYVRHHHLMQRHHLPLDECKHELAIDITDDQDDRDFMYHIIEQLDELNRALLLLYLEEHSYQQISEILGITITNVSSKINRLKQRLRNVSQNQNI